MMKTLLTCATLVLLAGCSDTHQARREAIHGDRPARVTCSGYQGVLFDGRSTGRIVFDETGRINFVDAATGRLNVVEGECRVEYAR